MGSSKRSGTASRPAARRRSSHWGGVGCLETTASTHPLLRRARELAVHAPESAIHRLGAGVDLETVVAAFEAGDELAHEVVTDAAQHLGRTIGALVGVLNVEHVVLVGEMTRFGDPWLSVVRRAARRSALDLLADQTRIEIGRLGPDLVVLGSAALLMTRELGLAFAR